MLPKMPTPAPKLVLKNLEAHLMFDIERYSSGKTAMTLGDTELTMREGNHVVGKVSAAIGGGVVVRIGNRDWAVNMKDIWVAVRKAQEKQYGRKS